MNQTFPPTHPTTPASSSRDRGCLGPGYASRPVCRNPPPPGLSCRPTRHYKVPFRINNNNTHESKFITKSAHVVTRRDCRYYGMLRKVAEFERGVRSAGLLSRDCVPTRWPRLALANEAASGWTLVCRVPPCHGLLLSWCLMAAPHVRPQII
ncbi:hypothetical protein E2C01_013958 [Portunus trituberculatus]|uniref:Uncharacterized protein n=1 Tax=Portunus trituberculatus TaxID=210409 RepID=A0A5B7DIS5_PORTR|nr:hypothetical protein [Portunus trituberculatus]